MLNLIDEIWGKVLGVLMGMAAVYVGLIMVAIVYASAFRFFGFYYSPYTSSNMALFSFCFWDHRGSYETGGTSILSC